VRAGTPFRAARMMFAALAAVAALPVHAQREAVLKIGGYEGRGKGGKKRPSHRSHRFVAQDKRDARKARNRR